MKVKKFDDYLKKRLDSTEIQEINKLVELEYESIKALQRDVSQMVEQYMVEENIGFNELARRLNFAPTQVSKIKKGEANLTLTSLAHLAALFNKKPHIVFENIHKATK